MPGYCGHAESLVEALGAAVDGECVKDEIFGLFCPASSMSALMRRVPMPPP